MYIGPFIKNTTQNGWFCSIETPFLGIFQAIWSFKIHLWVFTLNFWLEVNNGVFVPLRGSYNL